MLPPDCLKTSSSKSSIAAVPRYKGSDSPVAGSAGTTAVVATPASLIQPLRRPLSKTKSGTHSSSGTPVPHSPAKTTPSAAVNLAASPSTATPSSPEQPTPSQHSHLPRVPTTPNSAARRILTSLSSRSPSTKLTDATAHPQTLGLSPTSRTSSSPTSSSASSHSPSSLSSFSSPTGLAVPIGARSLRISGNGRPPVHPPLAQRSSSSSHSGNPRRSAVGGVTAGTSHPSLPRGGNRPSSSTTRRPRSNTHGSGSGSGSSMGGCVTKGGAVVAVESGLAAPLDAKAMHNPHGVDGSGQRVNGGSGHPAMSPSTRPTDAESSAGGSNNNSPDSNTSSDRGTREMPLQNPERRRLSLSQSDPARPDQPGSENRGHFVFNKNQPGAAQYNRPSRVEEEDAEEVDLLNSEEEEDPSQERSVDSEEDDESAENDDPHHAANRAPDWRAPQKPPQCRRLSVSGMPSSMKQQDFENKREEVKSDTGYFDTSTLLSLGIGYACKKGLKPESPNQDDFFIVRIDDWGLYGVFDGHGPYGHDVSNFVQRELPKLIYNDPNFLSDPKAALRNSFIGVHRMLETASATHNLFDCALSGSTATVVLHRKAEGKLYVAHVGDSRCVLGRLKKGGGIEHHDLTNDHKPNNEAEKRRIVASGGQVRRLEGDIPYRVFLKGRLYPGLAMSRALGDTVGAAAGVTCEPDVMEHHIDPKRDLFIALCSDGVWEFLSSQAVIELIHRHGINGVQLAADLVARESWNLWIREEGNVVDDITSEIIYLNPENAPVIS